jgi:hypothetical protein
MPRLNLYEMANPFRAPRSSGAEMGAAPTQALGEMGDAAFAIGERIQKREENAISDQALGEVDTQLLPLLADLEKNPANMPEALNQFQAGAQKIRADVLGKVNLRPEARAALERQIDNQLTQYGKSAIAMRIKSGINQVVARLNQQFDTGVNQVSAAPSIMKDVIETNRHLVESRKDSMDPLMYEAAMKKAHAGPIQAAVNSYLAQQLPDKADELLQNPEINKLIDPDALRPLRINVAVEKGKRDKEEREIESNRKALSYLLGTEATREQAVTVSGLASMPVAQKLNVLKMMNGGKDLPQTTIDKVMGLERQASESRIDKIVELTSNYDTLDANDRLKLTALIKSEWRDVNTVDSFGNPGKRLSTVPAEFARFVDPMGAGGGITGSISNGSSVTNNKSSGYNGGSSSAAASEQLAIMQRERENPANSPEDNAALDREIARVRGSSDQQAPAGDNVDDDVVDLYANYDKMTGLEAFVKRNAANLPLNIGDRLKINPAYGKAAMASEVLTNDIVRGFISMGEGKDTVANQYRQELKKIVSIEPKLIGSDREYLFKLQTISKELKQRRNEYQKIAETGATKDMRTASIAAVATITKILSRIPIPEKVVNSDEEFAKLKPGEVYMTSDDPRPRRKGGVK